MTVSTFLEVVRPVTQIFDGSAKIVIFPYFFWQKAGHISQRKLR